MAPCETLATTSSQPNSKSLVARVVLAQPRVTFHPCTCGLCRGAAALISYDDVKVATKTIIREEAIMIDYFLYTDARLRWITAPTILPLLSVSSGNDP
jgi:hypothetical protein